MKAAAPGSLINGYDRLEVSQLSLGFIKSFPECWARMVLM